MMLALVWHVFLVVWISGGIVFVIHRYERQPSKRLERQVKEQILQTRLAELQSRERKALEV